MAHKNRGYKPVEGMTSPAIPKKEVIEIELTQNGMTRRSNTSQENLSIPEERYCYMRSRRTKQSPLASFISWCRKLQESFGAPALILIGVVYWAQGFKSFSVLATNYLFKDEFKLDPSSSQTLTTLMYIPWGIKPLYGILSDSLPLFGYHRRPYLLACGCLSCWAYVMLSFPSCSPSALWCCFFLFLTNLSTAFNDVVIDARIVEISRLDPIHGANDLQTLSWTMMSLGGVMGSFLSGPATERLGWRYIFFFAAFGPFLVILLTLKMPEDRATGQFTSCIQQAKHQTAQLINALRHPRVWRSALWIFLSCSTAPSFSQLTFYYVTDVLNFTAEFLGIINAIGYIFLIFGTVLYNTWFTNISFRKMFFWTQIALAIVSSADLILVTRTNLALGIPDKVFVLGDEVLSDVVGRIKTMPVLVLCAKLCPKGVEGTLFALLMSISNFALSVSSFTGALLCDFLGISRGHYTLVWAAVLIRSLCKIFPVFCLGLIPNLDHLDLEEKEEDEEELETGEAFPDRVKFKDEEAED